MMRRTKHPKLHYWKNYRWWQKMIFITATMDLFIIAITVIGLSGDKIKWVGLGILIIFLFIAFMLSRSSHFLKKMSTNLFIFGPKGSGKDLIMQKSIYLKYDTHTLIKYLLNRNRKTPLANDDYGYGTKFVEPKEVFNLYPNTYANLIESEIVLIEKKDDFEGRDYYLTDSAIYFPSQEDSKLNKEYPSFPLFYATSRHLYDMNIIVNTQVNSRLWKKLREQVQDGYIEAITNYGWSPLMESIPIIRNYVFIQCRYYSKLESAELGLLPFKKIAIINNMTDQTIYMTTAGATEEQYKAQNGIIRDMTIILNKRHIKYDTRVFHKKFFGYKSSTTKQQYRSNLDYIEALKINEELDKKNIIREQKRRIEKDQEEAIKINNKKNRREEQEETEKNKKNRRREEQKNRKNSL